MLLGDLNGRVRRVIDSTIIIVIEQHWEDEVNDG